MAVVGECGNGREAVAAIQSLAPDLVFLDIQMPVMNGFEVLDAVGAAQAPVVIFVTAYDRYALRAFEIHALDYLLKPFDRERFQTALQRARDHVERRDIHALRERLARLMEARERSQTDSTEYLTRLAVRTAGRV